MKDADEVDDRIGVRNELTQSAGIVHVRFDHVDGGQQEQRLAAIAATRRHDDTMLRGDEVRNDVTADEARAAEHENA